MIAAKATYPVTVEFANCQLLGKHVNGQDFVAMRPIVEGMGLDWQKQLEKIQRHPVLSRQLCLVRGMVAADGKRRTMSCLPLSRVAFWLATVNSRKVAADIRDRVIAFQEQAADVLHAAFTQQHTTTHLWRTEYLPTYHELHDTIANVAAQSSNAKFVHMNVNKAINSACGLESGQRATANARQAVLLMAAQMAATSALQQASDHKTGYLACKRQLQTLVNTVQALPWRKPHDDQSSRSLTREN